MANVKTFPNGKVAIDCPECGKTRDAKDFQGNPDHKSGWFTMCKYCRTKQEFTLQLGKPDDAEWDDVAFDPCPACGGSGQYLAYTSTGMVITGPCYRCKNKGHQTWRDAGRNISYDSWAAAKAIRGDMKQFTREEAEKVVAGMKNVGPSKEEKEVKKPLKKKKATKKVKKAVAKPESESCDFEPGEFHERDLFDSDEEYAAWRGEGA